MLDMFSTLSAEHIQALTPVSARNVQIEVVTETGSTNADLLARVPQLDGPVLRVAASQTAGRGRAGRSWQAAPNAALLCSLAWPLYRPRAGVTGLTLAVGVVLARTLADFGLAVRLKWPNDVLLDGGKLAGILVETVSMPDADGVWAVIGMGINVQLPPLADEAGIGKAAQAPELMSQRNAMLAALLAALTEALPQFARHGLAPFVADWNRLHAHAGQEVRILDQGRVLHQGRALGIDASGRLLLDTLQGQVSVLAGDVSLRAQAGCTPAASPLSALQPCKG